MPQLKTFFYVLGCPIQDNVSIDVQCMFFAKYSLSMTEILWQFYIVIVSLCVGDAPISPCRLCLQVLDDNEHSLQNFPPAQIKQSL